MTTIEEKPLDSDHNPKPESIHSKELVNFAPDGGFGWVIAFSSFLINLVVDGTAYSFGIFFDAFVNQFKESRAITALAGSLMVGCYLSAGKSTFSFFLSFLFHHLFCF